MSDYAGTVTLTCNSCGVSNQFILIYELVWAQKGGVVQRPKGYQCQQCTAIVDTATLVNRAMVERKKQELKDMQAELASEDIAAQPAGVTQ